MKTLTETRTASQFGGFTARQIENLFQCARRRSAWAVAIVCMGLNLMLVTVADARPLGSATVNEVNNDVRYQPGGGTERKARTKDVVSGADVVRTGMKSQAELQFEDRTITRLGSNSIFSFDPQKREFDLKQGLMLFDMPKGAGGGRIVTSAGTAAVEGTAGIVSSRGPMKVICLAGIIRVTDKNGKTLAVLKPGQMFIQGVTKRPVDIRLRGMNGVLLVGGLPNNVEEEAVASNQQEQQIQQGILQQTPLVLFGEGRDLHVLSADTIHTSAYIEAIRQDNAKTSGQSSNPPFEGLNNDSSISFGENTVTLSGANGAQTTYRVVDGTAVLKSAKEAATFTGQVEVLPFSGRPPRLQFQAPELNLTRFDIDVTSFTPGNLSFISTGSAAGQGVFVSDSTVNVSSTDQRENSTSAGGNVLLKAENLISLQETTDIRADGPVAGSIRLESGSSISLDVTATPDEEGSASLDGGYIRLSAQGNFFSDEPATGDIQLLGDINSAGQGTIQFAAFGPNGGGGISLASANSIVANDVGFDVHGGAFDAGSLSMQSGEIALDRIYVNANSTAARGGQISIVGERQVQINGDNITTSGTTIYGTDIQANGATAGSINIQAKGDETRAGDVSIEANDIGCVRLSAQATTAVLDAIVTGGDVIIAGADTASGKSVTISASAPANATGDIAGGNLSISAFNTLDIRYAKLTADASGNASAGTINLIGNDIYLDNVQISASSPGGSGGVVNIIGAGSATVTLHDTSITTTGVTGGAIYIRGGTVNFTGNDVLNAGGGVIRVYSNNHTGAPTVVGGGSVEYLPYVRPGR